MLITLFNCCFQQLHFPVFTPQLLNKLCHAGLAWVARNSFYVGKLALRAGGELFPAGDVLLQGEL